MQIAPLFSQRNKKGKGFGSFYWRCVIEGLSTPGLRVVLTKATPSFVADFFFLLLLPSDSNNFRCSKRNSSGGEVAKSDFPALPSRHFQSVFLWLVSWGKDKRLHEVSFSTLMKPVLPAHSFKLLLQCAAGSARQVSVALRKEAEENIYDFLDRQLDKTSGIQSIRITCFSCLKFVFNSRWAE